MEKQHALTLSDSICAVRSRKIKKTFSSQIHAILDWSSINEVIGQYYTKGKRGTGKPAYDGLLLFQSMSATDVVWVK